MDQQGEYYSQRRDVLPEELLSVFEPQDIIELSQYQEGLSIATVVNKPYSKKFYEKYGPWSHLLSDNEAYYDEEIEDAIFADKVIRDLVDARSRDTNNTELTRTLRIRRSVVISVMTLWKQALEETPHLSATGTEQ